MIEPFASSCVHSILEYIDQSLWNGVANLSLNHMLPKSVSLQSKDAIETLVYVSFAEKFQPQPKMPQENDPSSAPIDSFSNGAIVKQEVAARSISNNHTKTKQRSMYTQISKHSVHSSKFVPQNSKDERKNTKVSDFQATKKQSFFISLGAHEPQSDGNQQKFRKIKDEKLAQSAKRKQILQKNQKKNQQMLELNEKTKKDNKLFTFNYEGEYSEANPLKLGKQQVRMMKQTFQAQKVYEKERKKIQQTQIEYTKLHKEKSRNKLSQGTTNFRQKSISLAEVFTDPSKISDGVKITELKGDNNAFTLEGKSHKSNNSFRLKDYKNMTKDKSFREFKINSNSAKKNTILDFSTSEIDNKEDQKNKTIAVSKERQRIKLKSRGKSSHELKAAAETSKTIQKALGRGLPFIRTKGLRFYDIESQASYKTLQFNFSSQKKSKKISSRVKIGDLSLYEDLLLN